MGLLVREAAPLAEGVHDEMFAPAAAPLPLVVAEDGEGAGLVRLGENARARFGLDERRLLGRGVALAAGRADKGLAGLLEAVVDRFRPHERDRAAAVALDFRGFHVALVPQNETDSLLQSARDWNPESARDLADFATGAPIRCMSIGQRTVLALAVARRVLRPYSAKIDV